MRRLFQDTTTRLQEFVAQRDTLLLVVQCRDEETAYVTKTIDAIEEASQDIFFGYGDVFTDPAAYADAVVATFQKQAALLGSKLAGAGDPTWPPLPVRVTDRAESPVKRLQTLFMYARTRIPDIEASHLVIVLCPLHVAHPLPWRAFLRELIEHDIFAPWCHHMRIIAREPEVVSFEGIDSSWRTALDLAKYPRTATFPVDFSIEALHRATKAEIVDPSVPLADRMQSLLVDANVDYAHQRYDHAVEKYQLLRTFYATLGNQAMLAAVLNGLGEVYARIEMIPQAIEHFEMAITPAVESQCHPVLLNISLNLGNLHFTHHAWASAVEFYVGAEALATALLNANVKLACLENIGVCKVQLGDFAGAQQAWTDGATLARSVAENEALRRHLGRLRVLYAEANMRAQVSAIDTELRGMS